MLRSLTFPRMLAGCLPPVLGVFFIFVPAPSAALAEGACPNEALRTGLSAHLPDCRAYEQVSPAYKEGAEVGVEALGQDGAHVLLQSHGSFSDPEQVGSFGEQYETVRGPDGWTTRPLTPPFPAFNFTTRGLSADFTTALMSVQTPAEPVEEEGDVYLGPPAGSLTPVGPLAPSTSARKGLVFLAASGDLHRSFFYVETPPLGSEQPRSLWPGDTTVNGSHSSLYEYEYTGEAGRRPEPRLVGISNVGVPGTVGEGHLISNCGVGPGGYPPSESDMYNAVSLSGDTVFLTAEAGGGACVGTGPAVNEVYARIAGAPGEPAHTVAISEPSKVDCSACETFETEPQKRSPAVFQGASEDGSKVFFTSEQPLLPGAVGAGPFLYAYDFAGPAGGQVTLLSGGDPAGSRVQGVARVSQDGSHVYFVAQGVLAGANGEHKAPAQGQDNLYVHDTRTGATAFVTMLSAGDEADWRSKDYRPVQATPDGRFLVFQSTTDLTADQEGRQEAGQVFAYDAESETLVRVSRGEGAYNQDGNSSEHAATIPVQFYQQEVQARADRFENLALSSDGSRVFFSSEDALTPQAVNGVLSVYEYHAGHVALISDGHDPAVLNGTDESGEDVFLTTAGSLVSQDTDDQQDVYDAREGGGFPSPPEPTRCAGDSCQAPSPAGPALAGAQQTTLSVVGEAGSPPPPTTTQKGPKPLRCRRGEVLRKKRCVKRKRARNARPKSRATR